MEASIVWGAGCVTLAMGAGFSFGKAAWVRAVRRKRISAGLFPRRNDVLRRIVRNGFVPLLPISRGIARMKAMEETLEEAVRALSARGVASSAEALVSLALVAFGVIIGITTLVFSSLVGGLCLCICLVMASMARMRALRERRVSSMREQVPDALRSLSVCFQSGLSLEQAFQQTALDLGGPLGELFSQSARSLGTGGSTEEALSSLRDQAGLPELAFVSVALEVQHQSGGSMAHVLEVARQSVEEDFELRRSLQVQTSQAKMSAQIVTMMPFILVAVFSLISDGFLDPFFESAIGMGLLLLALSMEVAGIYLVRRMLNVEVG